MSLPQHIGRYRVLAFLGRGAMGVVYRGRDERLERDVALKVMSVGLGTDAEARARFEREARAAARLQHPNIVTVYELGEHLGAPFIAMELLEGLDLQRAIEAGIRPDPKVTLPVVLQVLAGLGHAHEKGIVHRDVKPSNIFLARGLPAKIMDFGVARLTGSTATSGGVTGTPTYMSPEQVRGDHLDGRSDLFSTGLILYELVTGEKAYRADSVVAVLYKIAHEEPDLGLMPPGDEWEGLRKVLTRALAYEAEDRYPDARTMATDLAATLRELGGEADGSAASDLGLLIRSTPRPQPATYEATTALPEPTAAIEPTAQVSPASRHWPVPAVATAAAGALAIGILATVLVLRRDPPPAPPATGVSPLPGPSPTTPASPVPSPDVGPTTTPTPRPEPTPSARPTLAPTPEPTPEPTAPPPTPTPAPLETPTPGPAPAEARVDRAEALLAQGRFQAALAEAKAVLTREPGNRQARTLAEDAEIEIVVESRIKEATEALRRGDKDAALDAVKAGLAAKPNDRRLIELFREAVR